MEIDYDGYIAEIDGKMDVLIEDVISYMGGVNENYIKKKIRDAYDYSKEAHKGQMRLSGYPYINHPVESTLIMLSLKPDVASIQACLLHDVIEDTPRTYDDIEKEFGEEVAFLCSGMEKLGKVRYKGEDRAVGSLRKMFVAMAEDLRVILIKLSDRLHNMQTLKFHPKKEKRERIALETLNIYAPIAERLGLYKIKSGLEKECFKILQPKEYKEIKKDLEKLSDVRSNFKETAICKIQEILSDLDIKHQVDFRIKSIYSIYKKINRKEFDDINDLYDIYGIRIMVKDLSDCYRVLGEIHKRRHPLPYRFKDYIALPKPNGYRSLHTTVIGFLKSFTKQPTEIQIRTFDMHTEAEIGVAAHFEYKESGGNVRKDINWVKELKELTENLGNQDLMSSLKIDVFKNRIFVFTPKGDAINLPSGSTVIDFAYYVHSDLGNHISVAKVNHSVYPLDKELKNGDIVNIVIDKNKSPSPFRLSFVKTSKAKNNIRSYLKKENKDLHRERGRDIMNHYFERLGLSAFDKDLAIMKVIDGKENNMEERYQILEQVGNFSLTPASLYRRLFKDANKTTSKPKKGKGAIKIESTESKRFIIGGEENQEYNLCSCLKKETPDRVVAHINSRGLFTLHKRDCEILEDVNKDRLMSAYLKGQEETTILVNLVFKVKNKLGVLKSLSETMYAMNINIDEISTKKTGTSGVNINLTIEIPDHDYLLLDRFIERVKFKLKERLVDSTVKKIEHK